MSAEVKHTPGPWQKAHRNGFPVVRGAATECVATLPSPDFEGYGVTSLDEREANRLLIAAAPDLLEALQSASHFVREHYAPAIDAEHDLMGKINAAIAKATGAA